MLDINDNGDYSAFALLDSALHKYSVFFTGEAHHVKGNTEIQWKMLKYLYSKAGVRILFMERPRSYSYLLNYYTVKQDSTGYDSIVNIFNGGTKDLIFFKTLYRFNMRLPENERIILRGIDREFSSDFTVSAVRHIFTAHGIPAQIREMYTRPIETKDRGRADSLLYMMQRDTSLQQHFGKAYRELISILNAHACKTCDPPSERVLSQNWLDREDLIYKNFLELIQDYPGHKFYGQLGSFHTYLTQPNKKKLIIPDPVASRLNSKDDSPVKGMVCSIRIDYYLPPNEFTREHRKNISDIADEAMVLFKLDNPGTPFGYVSTFYQYLLLADFTNKNERDYNRKNDHYDLMENETYTVSALSAGYQYWKHEALEFGWHVTTREMKSFTYNFGTGLFFEFNPKQRLHTYRATMWGGRNMFFGLSLAYSTSYKHSAFFIRPELGIKRRIFSLTYSYNAKLYNRRLDGINRSMISFRMLMPLKRI